MTSKNSKNFFKDKKITVIGLGLLGGAANDIDYLASQGAQLTVTDLKSGTELESSLRALKKYRNIKFVLGKHDLEDFKNADMILEPGNVPVDSPYLQEARKNKIPVFVSESLFAKYAEEVSIIGVTGTRGKSTTTALIYEILSKNLSGVKVYLGGNVRNVSTLALLEKVKPKDVVVMELDSWALHGMGDIKISPHISVFTNFFPDHMSYYAQDMEKYFLDKSQIFKYQTKEDVLIVGDQALPYVQKWGGKIESKLIVPKPPLPSGWRIGIIGEHNIYNATLAVEVAKELGIEDKDIKNALESFKGVPGRMELIREVKGVKYYNDTTATTPEATIAALRALGKDKNIILIAGGFDKGLDMNFLLPEIKKYCKEIIFLSGSGTDKIKDKIKNSGEFGSMEPALVKAQEISTKGDIVLLSPAFASFGMFNNEFDRGDQFLSIVKGLK